MEYFFSSTIIKVLIAEMRHMFSLENIPVLRSMTYLNPDTIPKENEENSLNYGENFNIMQFSWQAGWGWFKIFGSRVK